jgi:uncharacterized protein (TIGR02466 family)
MTWSYRAALTKAPETAQAFDIFATRIWQLRLKHLFPHFPEWTAAIEAMRAAAPVPAGRTNRGGWNSAGHALLNEPIFAPLRDAAHEQSRLALAEMGIAEPVLELQSWANLHDRGGFNFLHMHEGCLLSGCFYLRVPEGSGNLVFRDPRPGVLNSFAKGAAPNAYRDIQLRPEAGLMVLFPHWLEHFVEVHASNIPRICIPFNAVGTLSHL